MDRDDRLVPEGSDFSHQPSHSRQNISSSCQSGSSPSLQFFGQQFATSGEYRYIVDQLQLRTEETLSEEMINRFVQWLDEDHSRSTVLHRTIDNLQNTESFCKHQASKKQFSTQNSHQRTEYYDPGPSTSQARFSVSELAARFTNSQWHQDTTMFNYPGISSELGDNVGRFCVPESARSMFRQTHTESGSRIGKCIPNVQILPSASNIQHRIPLQTVIDKKSPKLIQRSAKTASAKVISFQKWPLQLSLVPKSLHTTFPSTQEPSQIPVLPSTFRLRRRCRSTSRSLKKKSLLTCSGLHFSSLPHLKVTTPALNSLQMQLLLQNTIKMGVAYYDFTSNSNYKPCESLMNRILNEQPTNQFSLIYETDSSSCSTPLLSSSSSLDKVTEERLPNIVDLRTNDTTVPDTLYQCGLRLAIKKTHLHSRRFEWNQIFFVPTELCPAVQTAAELALGFCVTYVRECEERWCKVNCHRESFICLHMYSCSCPQTKKTFGWCSHIHAATYCGLRTFYHDTLAFVPTTSGVLKIHHLRAKYKYMKLLKNWPANLKAKLDNLELHGTIKQLRTNCVCPKYKRCKECTACYCNYKCKCFDYKRLRFPCEHIHYVAMCTRKKPLAVLANEFRHYDYQTDDSDDETDADASYVVEEHHQRSFCIKRRQIQQVSRNLWTVKSNNTWLKYQVTLVRDYNKKPGEQSECIQCRDKKAFNWMNCCVRCSICPHDYTCTCDENEPKKKSICKHIHAVARNFRQKRRRKPETDEILAPGRMYSSTESEDSDSWGDVEL